MVQGAPMCCCGAPCRTRAFSRFKRSFHSRQRPRSNLIIGVDVPGAYCLLNVAGAYCLLNVAGAYCLLKIR